MAENKGIRLQITGYNGQYFPVDSTTIVRCVVTDTQHWRHGVHLDNELRLWDYRPFYSVDMVIQKWDKSLMKAKDKPLDTYSEVTVHCMISPEFFQEWHRCKGAGYNNPQARAEFLNAWIQYYAKEVNQ